MKLIIQKTDKGTVYQCSCCGKEYNDVPFCFGSEVPAYYFSIPPEERKKRIEKTESLCVVDERHFFHRGRLTIPINDSDQDLLFDIWASISEVNFYRRNELWNDPQRVNESPYFGWLQTIVPTYGDTINIKCIAIENEAGVIPSIQIIEEEHPLKVDQENGITFERALEIVSFILDSEH
jgi:hypothetical protein